MNTSLKKNRKKRKPRHLRYKRPRLLVPLALFVILGVPNAAFYLLCGDRELMNSFIERVSVPFRDFLSGIFCCTPVSIAELLWYAAAVFALAYIIRTFYLLIALPFRLRRLLRRLTSIICAILAVLLIFNVCYGASYYGDSLSEKMGLDASGESVEELYAVTEYFAQKVNSLCNEVSRDGDGHYSVDRSEIFGRSYGIYDAISAEYPCLAGENRRPKPMLFSKLYSYLGFTGFFFPVTAETNLNVDSPAFLLPSTIAHEMAHQRGVAPEQEANFTAVIACMSCGDAVYEYSGAMLAYIHLGNALYSADYELWYEIYSTLDPLVRLDFSDQSAYWDSFEGKVSENAGEVYEHYLHSYSQDLGLKSYGACVDLLVAYYSDRI